MLKKIFCVIFSLLIAQYIHCTGVQSRLMLNQAKSSQSNGFKQSDQNHTQIQNSHHRPSSFQRALTPSPPAQAQIQTTTKKRKLSPDRNIASPATQATPRSHEQISQDAPTSIPNTNCTRMRSFLQNLFPSPQPTAADIQLSAEQISGSSMPSVYDYRSTDGDVDDDFDKKIMANRIIIRDPSPILEDPDVMCKQLYSSKQPEENSDTDSDYQSDVTYDEHWQQAQATNSVQEEILNNLRPIEIEAAEMYPNFIYHLRLKTLKNKIIKLFGSKEIALTYLHNAAHSQTNLEKMLLTLDNIIKSYNHPSITIKKSTNRKPLKNKLHNTFIKRLHILYEIFKESLTATTTLQILKDLYLTGYKKLLHYSHCFKLKELSIESFLLNDDSITQDLKNTNLFQSGTVLIQTLITLLISYKEPQILLNRQLFVHPGMNQRSSTATQASPNMDEESNLEQHIMQNVVIKGIPELKQDPNLPYHLKLRTLKNLIIEHYGCLTFALQALLDVLKNPKTIGTVLSDLGCITARYDEDCNKIKTYADPQLKLQLENPSLVAREQEYNNKPYAILTINLLNDLRLLDYKNLCIMNHTTKIEDLIKIHPYNRQTWPQPSTENTIRTQICKLLHAPTQEEITSLISGEVLILTLINILVFYAEPFKVNDLMFIIKGH